jgi:hypothetical protein
MINQIERLFYVCTSPLQAYRSRSWSDTGSWPIVFNKSEGFKDKKLFVGCGQCIECRMEKARMWAIRCCHEAQWNEEEGKRSCFVTLTYNDDNLPHVKSNSVQGRYYPTLVKRDIQLFCKRLRKKGYDFRYFVSGEYGGIYGRPHYHMLIFGWYPSDCYITDVSGSGYDVYSSDILDETWSHGLTFVQDMCFETAFYTAGYALKKLTGSGEYYQTNFGVKDAEEYYDGIQPEFLLMSRRPSIGLRWFEKYRQDVYPDDKIHINNMTVLPPRYYFNKEVELEEKEGGRKTNVLGKLTNVRIETIKRIQAHRKEIMSEDIKVLQSERKRVRNINQHIKEKRYEQQRKVFGKGFHDLRQKELRVLKTNERKEC